MTKNFVLDTNILLQTEGRIIHGLDDNTITIPGIVLEELDNMKSALGEKGFAARECIRKIAAFDNDKESGNLQIVLNATTEEIPKSWNPNKPDNIILATVQNLIKNNTNGPIILITNDIAMQIKARKLGISVQDYKNDQVQDQNEFTGRDIIEGLNDATIDKLYKKGSVQISRRSVEGKKMPRANEYAILKSVSGKSALGYVNGLQSPSSPTVELIKKEEYEDIFGISPKNAGQTFAVHALMAPVDEVPLVILKGCAGTGKTILSLAVALEQMQQGQYDKIIISRSNTLADEEMGFLPGDLEQKMGPLLSPFYDNLRHLYKLSGEDDEQAGYMIDDMIERGTIEIVSLAYIRGRSIPNAFIIVDEAQNLSATQAKTIVTRCGLGSKVVLLGDPGQIDSARLDRRNNGLTYLSEKFKNLELCRQLTFTVNESVRSPLASRAIEILEE